MGQLGISRLEASMFAEFEDIFLLYSFYIQGSLLSMLLNNHQRILAYQRHDVSPSPNILIEFPHALCGHQYCLRYWEMM